MPVLSIDFETRSLIELRDTGAHLYAAHPSTDIWCMAYAFDDEEVECWAPRHPYQSGDHEWRWHTLALPERIREHVAAGGTIRAHNAQFERLLWREVLVPRYGAPPAAMEQFECSAAEAAAMGLPRSLDGVANVLGVSAKKDKEGHALMLRMCRPRSIHRDGTPTWWTVPERVARLIDYCKQDVRAEQAVSKHLRRLSPEERAVYLLDQRVNDRGVKLDRSLAEGARQIVQVATERSTEAIQLLTNGEVDRLSQHGRFLTWLQEQGLDVKSVDKHAVQTLLERDDLPPAVQQALRLRAEGAKSSVAKIEAMLACADPRDDRMRGLLLYHGASTGRWCGQRVQPQNFPRGSVKDVEQYLPLVRAGREGYEELDLWTPPMETVAAMLRPMLIAEPGQKLFVADFAGIEARVLAWLAGDKEKCARFAAGQDEYRHLAAAIYQRPVETITKDERQFGKVGELGCGYGMGAPKLVDTAAKQFGVTLSLEEAQKIVRTYRERNHAVTGWWYDLEAGARRAVQQPGTEQRAGRVRFVRRGPYLWARLPSGRLLCYPSPRVRERETPWGEMRASLECWGVNSVTRKWEAYDLYGGLWAENIVQAVSRDLLAEAMLRLEAAGWPVILSVHDEVIAERAEGTDAEFLALMTQLPSWAEGCPVAAEGWSGSRYRK